MAPPPWATRDETTWLHSQMATYLTKKADGTLWKFWPEMNESWFRRFPEESKVGLPGLTEAGDAPNLTPVQSDALKEALVTRKGVSRVFRRF